MCKFVKNSINKGKGEHIEIYQLFVLGTKFKNGFILSNL